MAKRFGLKVPARISLLGNPADANEVDYHTISCAIEKFAAAFVQPAEKLTLEILEKQGPAYKLLQTVSLEDSPPYEIGEDDDFSLVKAAMNKFYNTSAELRERWGNPPLRISTCTEVPRQSGLGGSSLFVILALAALREFYDLNRLEYNDYLLAELTQRTEERELGITCGYADRYVPLFGGLAYLDYRGKFFHKEIEEEPFVTYERLDQYVAGLPLVIASTGLRHKSGDVHSIMREKYLEEYNAFEANPKSEKPFMLEHFERIGATAWRGKKALLKQDWKRFGELMNENHLLIDQVMEYCGIKGGAGQANNLLIQRARENGALGAKLPGAGGGGSIFALVSPGSEPRMIDVLCQALEEVNLEQGCVFKCGIAHRGLVTIK